MSAVRDPARAGGRQPGPQQPRARHSAGGGQRSAPTRPARPVLDRGRGRFGPFGIGQLVAWQVGAACVLFGLASDGWTHWVGAGPAVVIVLLTLTRAGNRWLYQWLAVRWRFWWRVPRPVTDPQVDPRLLPLRELLPELDVLTTEGRGGERLGVVQDGHAWVALVEVGGDDDLLPGQANPVSLPVRNLADVLSVDDIRLAAVQVLVHTVPAPSGLLTGTVGSAVSYQQLSSGRVPAGQLVWVALRLDPALCPDAVTARGGGLDGVHRALRRCVARTVEVLESAGITCRGLDAEEVRSVLATSAGVASRRTPPGTRHTGEQWRMWTCDGVVHGTYWLRGWPSDPSRGVPALLDQLVSLPALFTTLSVALLPRDGDRIRFQTMVRISCVSADAVRQVGAAVRRSAAELGFRVSAMDGEQAPAALATLPIGGGVR